MAPAEQESASGFAFLFRTDQGLISRAQWWRGTLDLAAVLAALTGVWLVIGRFAYEAQAPEARADLFDAGIFAAYAYLIFFGFCVMLIGVCHYNLSANRCRARGRASALAGLLPLFALFSGAAHWLYPRVSEDMPYWTVGLTDLILVAVILWNVVDLGLAGQDPGQDP